MHKLVWLHFFETCCPGKVHHGVVTDLGELVLLSRKKLQESAHTQQHYPNNYTF